MTVPEAATPTTPAPTKPPEAGTPPEDAAPTTEAVTQRPDECDFGEVADTVRGAVVQVFTNTGSGTAFHIGGGRYVTAAQVVQDEAGRTLPFIEIVADGVSYNATVELAGSFSRIGTERDLAVLQAQAIPQSLLTRSPMAEDTDIDVRAFGYPWSSVSDRDQTDGVVPLQTSKGIVSAITLADGIELIQTDASVDRGMSGGPLVDECGSVLAVASFLPSTDDVDDPGDFAGFISVAELANLD